MITHFSVDPAWLTDHVRTLWAEGSYSGAFRILKCVQGLSIEDQFKIIMGTARLVDGQDDGLALGPDTWEPPDSWEYPDPASMGTYVDHSIRAAMESKLQWEAAAQEIIRDAQYGAEVDEGGRSLLDRFQILPKEVQKRFDREFRDALARRQEFGVLEKTVTTQQQPAFEQMIAERYKDNPGVCSILMDGARALGLSPRPADRPKLGALDPEMTQMYAWVDPRGRYYGCGYMEHAAVADALGKTERDLERLGWLKISPPRLMKGDRVPVIHCSKKMTQRQRDKLFDWCQKYDRDYEEVLKFAYNERQQ